MNSLLSAASWGAGSALSWFQLLVSVSFAFVALSSARAEPLFRNVTATNLPTQFTAGPGMDVEAADIDNDGDLDILIPHEFAPNLLLLNDGSGVFSFASGRFSTQSNDSEDVNVADLDHDGDLDAIFVAEDNATHELYAGNGDATFHNVSSLLPKTIANAVAVGDLDGDTFADLVLGNQGQDLVLMNRGAGSLHQTPSQRTFVDETDQRLPPENITTQDVELSDVDRDGDLDLVCGNEGGNQLLINNGTGHFTDETATRFPQLANMETRKVTLADVDTDGDPDIFLSNVAFLGGKNPQNRLYLNDGHGFFTDVTGERLPATPGFTMDGKFIDADYDGDLDLITAGWNGPIRFFRNDGTAHFSEATTDVLPPIASAANIGIEIADVNRDGRFDIYVVRRGQADILLFAEATTSSSTPVNLSTRLLVQTGDNALIGGFIITGSAAKPLLIRGIGPSLGQAGIANPLSDPMLELRGQDGALLAENDDWRDTQQAAIEATGVPPQHEREAAIRADLVPGAYTAVLSGADGGTGVGLVELYDLAAAASAKLANISTRGAVQQGDNAMIGGLILGGNAGPADLLFRGIGPSLAAAGVPNPLADPFLSLHNANGSVIRENDDWRATEEPEIMATGIPPADEQEAAIRAILPPGNYTAVLRGTGGSTGVALVEVYNLQ
jgi:hypothetical protein